MDPEEKQLLEATAALAKENNKLLKKMHRQNVYASVGKTIKWIVLIIVAIWTYIAIQPFLEQAKEMIQNIQETQQSMMELKAKTEGALNLPDVSNVNFSGLQKMLDAFTINGQ